MTDIVDNRVPPQAIGVERTVLGSMLIDDAAVEIAVDMLEENSFYLAANRHIFNSMVSMFNRNIPIDIVTITEELGKNSLLEAVGEEMYIAELVENIATSGNIEHYCNILLEKSMLRQMITTAGEITTGCFLPDVEPAALLDTAESKILSISEKRVKNTFMSAGQILPETFSTFDSYQKGDVPGVKSGFNHLDELTNGFQKSDLIIIAGRPSMGKTAFCLSVAVCASIDQKLPVAVFSLEMSRKQLIERIICGNARVNIHTLRAGRLPKRDCPKLSFAAGPLAEAPLFIDDTPGISVLELRSKARRLKSQHGLALIIIDYLQLMTGGGKQESRLQEVSFISRSLKGVAKELDVPVIALSQLSRAVEARAGNHRPQLSDLRESGSIEQDSDVVMFVYRDEVYNKDDNSNLGKAEIIIGKQRNGPIGTAHVAFIKEFAKFENLSELHGFED